MAQLNLLLLGPPGAGKGTQGQRLGLALGLPWISSGDLLRAAVRNGTEVGRDAAAHMASGTLVPDDIVVALISRRLAQDDTRNGFLLDGFPRTIEQAKDVDAGLGELGRMLSAAVSLTLADDEVVARLTGRRTCARCGRTYHLDFDPPRDPERCDADGEELVQRQDDNPVTIRQRLEVYHEQSQPLVAHYRRSRLLREVDGAGSPDVVQARLRAALGPSPR